MQPGLFVEAGRRAHVILRQDGTFSESDERERSTEIVNPPGGGSQGIWIEPWRVADGLEVVLDGQPLERFAVGYARQDGVSTIEHRVRDELRVAKRVWVPMQLPAVVMELDLEAANARREALRLQVRCATRLRLSLGWPLGTTDPPRLIANGDVLRADNALGHAAIACDPLPVDWTIQADRASWMVELRCAPGDTQRLRVVVAAGADDPSRVARKALQRADDLLRLRVEHYRRSAASAPRLGTPDPTLDRAFGACRTALDDFKHHDPAIGLGYVAGYPAYNFYFAGDAFRMLYGACALGDWTDTREALRTIVRGQRLEDDEAGQFAGELWHELSTTGHAISPNFVTLELPSILLHYTRWSGDLAFAREALAAAVRAGEWAARKDANSDGLPDNGPEQTFADGVREDLNVAGAHITPAAWQLRAFSALAELCALVGETAQARVWRRRALRTRRLVESTFWDAEQSRFVETIRPDGVPDTGPGFVPSFELRDPIDPGLRDASLAAELEEERALAAGRLGAAATFPPEARQARAYYVMDRGDRARRLLEAGFAEDGAAALSSIARLPFASTQAGFFPEIASRTQDVADPRGCFHQGWTAGYGLAYPVLAGVWGLRPDAAHARLAIAPRPPATWPSMRLDNLRVGATELSLTWRRSPDQPGAELAMENRGRAGLDLDVWLACPSGARRARVLVDGQRGGREAVPSAARRRRRREPGCDRLGVQVRLEVGDRVRVEAHWLPPGPEAAPRPAPRTARPEPSVRHTAASDATPGGRVRHMPAGDGTPHPSVRHTGPGDGTPDQAVRHTGPGDATPPEVVYLGFLAPPFTGLALRHVPLNYAARRPQALLGLLPTARALVVTDQQDAPLTDDLARAITSYVTEQGGALLCLCYWSAAWGRGFFDTYCSIARSSLPDLLPLTFRRAPIRTTRRLHLGGPGQALWADLPWPTAPPIDYQPADLRPGAQAWATADDPPRHVAVAPLAEAARAVQPAEGIPAAAADVPAAAADVPAAADDVLAASWTIGAGRAVALALDTFGFGHGTVVHWPGQRPLLRRALDWLLGAST